MQQLVLRCVSLSNLWEVHQIWFWKLWKQYLVGLLTTRKLLIIYDCFCR